MLANHLQTEMVSHVNPGGCTRATTRMDLNKPSMNKLKYYLIYLFMVMGILRSQAQTVAVTPSTICAGNQATLCVTYSPPSGRTVANYKFDLFNNSNAATTITTPANQPCYTYTYPAGNHKAKVSVILDNSTQVDATPVDVVVYNLPVINAQVISQDTQCFRGNYYVFKNLATQNGNSPSNPISFYYWNYGDANGDTVYTNADVGHTYYAPITVITGINILLSATDSKGCRKDSLFQSFIALKPNITPNFKWTFVSGPCFVSCYQFQNTSTPPANVIQSYEWDWGDGSKMVGDAQNDPNNHYDTITHCYRKDGQFNPALILTDLTGCTDSTRKRANNTTQALPQNINFRFDIVTTKSATDTATRKDTVCSGSGSTKNICFRMTPVSFAQSGAGDFVWNFGDPNDPALKNLDSSSWNPCHVYSGMGTFFPSITIKNVCPDTTFVYHSAISTFSRFDSAAFPDNDWGANPTPPPGAQVLPFQFTDPVDFMDSVDLDYTHTTRVLPQLRETNIVDTIIHAFTTAAKDRIIYFRRLDPIIDVIATDTFIKEKIRIPVTHIIEMQRMPGAKDLAHKKELVYNYRMGFDRPNVFFRLSPLITDTNNTAIQNDIYLYYKLINSFDIRSYGVEVVGPTASIELPPAGIVIKQSQKNQCGPTDTIDFVNTSAYFKSRKVWRRWDFDDNFAPQCTSFSVPRRGFPQPAPGGRWGQGPWTNAIQQDLGSDHFFIANGVIYPGRMSCKFSFDTLPRYAYPHWDTVYNWYRKGHDFMPWDYAQWDTVFPPTAPKFYVQPGDAKWWGKPVYLNIGTGEWSLTPGTTTMQYTIKSFPYTNPLNGQITTRYYVDTIPTTDVPNTIVMAWPRIDTMNLRTNNGQDLDPGSPLLVQNIPDPIGLGRGKYVMLNGPQIDTVGPTLLVKSQGDQWTISPKTPIPGGIDFYEYVFRRTIQRCLTVRQRLKDTVNNESFDPGGPYDSVVLDDQDCNDEATVQLALGKADARGLAIGGKLCPGLTTNAFGANIRFSFQQLGIYPGIKPSCGQTFVLFNYDSLADRKDLTPCDLDGFVNWQGGTTPGGITRPPFFSGANFNPMTVWTSPAGTTFIYHYGFNTGTPPPADTANGWITVGLQIGNGCKDTSRKNILMSQYRANLGVYQANMPAGQYTFAFNRIFNLRPLTPGIPDTLIDIEYVDCAFPRCVSTPVWYHNFLRIINLDAVFEEFPQQLPPNVWKLRGRGEEITVFYEDSIQDSVRYDSWQWGDATVTVDSFWYSGNDTTDGFYTNGVRRVRYNIDMLDAANPVIMDSTVWPIRASFPGATDGIKARQPGFFVPVSYDTLDYCTGMGKANPSYIIVDTALMFLPVKHRYVRTSWEADNRIDPYKGPDANISPMIHLVVSTAGCQQIAGKFITIGVIDTFDTQNSKGISDSVFCVNEEVFFYDSVRYWRYDASVSSLPFNPGGTRNPTQGTPPYSFLVFGFPENLMQIDTFNFWRHNEFYPLDYKGYMYGDSILKWNLSAGKYEYIARYDSVFSERIYWDFGDGNQHQGRNPRHSYEGYGRYKVSMFSRDSMGFWDTCVRYVNIVKPVAKIGLIQSVFNCGIPAVPMWDSSYMVYGTGPNTTDSVYLQYWWFGDNKNDTINPFTPATGNKQPEYHYNSNGKFRLKMVAQTFQGCYDTTYSEIFIKGPRPAIRLLSDTIGCSPFRVTIVNMADSFDMQAPNDTPTRKTLIDWGDGAQTILWGRRDTTTHAYPDSGVFTISVTGTDEDPITGLTTCLPSYFPDTINGANRPIKIYLVKFPVAMDVSKHHICIDEVFQVQNGSDPNYTSFQYKLYRGDDSLTTINQNGAAPNTVDHSFDSAGVYTIYGYPTGFGPAIPLASQKNCSNPDTMTVEVHKATPEFSTDTSNVPIFRFTNLSSPSSYYFVWQLFKEDGTPVGDKNGNINDKDWSYDLKDDTGSYNVCLIAITYDTLGHCPDTICHPIKSNFLTRITIPNVFSPDGNNINDFFKIDIEGETDYNLMIYNRWGDKVFESLDSKKLWNGTNMNDGDECPAGVYYFIFSWKMRGSDQSNTKTGTVTLIK